MLYCWINAGVLSARFLRQAYYQISELIQEDGDGYSLGLDGWNYPLCVRRGHERRDPPKAFNGLF
ncbi:hypothetical protein DFAR_2770021 [Desulfarculales bacterium]